MVSRKSGRSLNRRSKGSKRSKSISKKQVAKVAKKVSQQTTIIKRHAFAGLDQLCPYGTSPNGLFTGATFRVFLPLNISKDTSGSNSANLNARESARIFARNCQFQCNVQPSNQYLQPFQMRLMAGYYKGDDNAGTQGAGVLPATLKTLYPEINDMPYTKNVGQRDYYWKYKKTFNFCPKQLYDGVDESNALGGEDASHVTNSLWMPRTIKYNFRFNRVHEYEDADGDSLNGWTPLIVLQCMPLEGGTAFTRPNIESDQSNNKGAAPTPVLHTSMITYFNDCR